MIPFLNLIAVKQRRCLGINRAVFPFLRGGKRRPVSLALRIPLKQSADEDILPCRKSHELTAFLQSKRTRRSARPLLFAFLFILIIQHY